MQNRYLKIPLSLQIPEFETFRIYQKNKLLMQLLTVTKLYFATFNKTDHFYWIYGAITNLHNLIFLGWYCDLNSFNSRQKSSTANY